MTRRGTGEVLAAAAMRLAEAEIDSPRLDARLLLAHALGVPANVPLATMSIREEQFRAFDAFITRRSAREPLAYITGIKEFFSLDFEVGPGVLIPRPETETLVEEALRGFPDREAALEVLDLGTGSGCLIVAFLVQYHRAQGIGVDVSAEALVWATRNVARHGLARRCTLERGDWNAGGAFDVAFTNPPYLTEDEFARAPPEIGRYEPKSAFIAGKDGLASYKALIPKVAGALKPGGLAFIEIGAGQIDAVARIIEESGLELRRVAPDLAGISRCLIAGRVGRSRSPPQKTVGKELTTR